MTHESFETAPSGRRKLPIRFVVIGLLLVGLLSSAYFWWPWIAPVWVREGPMVQLADAHGFTLVWYTSRPASCRLILEPPEGEPGAPRDVPVTSVAASHPRHVARVDGLGPRSRYQYRIESGDRRLASGVARTSKLPDDAFTFVVFGDSGKGTSEQLALADQITALDPDFALHTGDLVYSGGERHRYAARFFEPYAELLARVPFWPCLGNHDVSKPELGWAYREVFELPHNGPDGLTPEHNYWFDYANARIAVIDSNASEDELRDRIAPWLIEVMRDAPGWRFVSFHHPPYTPGPHKPNAVMQRTLAPAIDAAQVDVVFNGHDHLYARSVPLRAGQPVGKGHPVGASESEADPTAALEPADFGTVYVVTGAGGAKLYEAVHEAQRPSYFVALNDSTHSFTWVAVHRTELHARQLGLGGRVLDEWRLEARPRSAE